MQTKSSNTMNILVVLPRIPFPLTDGGAIAQFSFLKHLSKTQGTLTIAALNTKKHYYSPDVLKPFGSVYTVDISTRINVVLLLTSLFKFTPYIVSRFYSKKFSSLLLDIIEKHSIDTIIFETPFLGEYVLDIRELNYEIDMFIRTHNTEFLIHERLSKSSSILKSLFYKRSAKQLKEYEILLSKLVQGLFTVSTVDKEMFEHIGVSTPIEVLPIGVELDRFQLSTTLRIPNTYFFFGSLDWTPNTEGLYWFIESVFPLIQQQIPDAVFHIGGKNPPNGFEEYCKNQGIMFHGIVEDASTFFQTYSVMVAPLLSGSGTRVKILEALAAKTPMVTTTVGIEGISFFNDSIHICDTPIEFSNSVVDFLRNKRSQTDLDKQRDFISKKYNWTKVCEKAIAFIEAKKNQADRTL